MKHKNWVLVIGWLGLIVAAGGGWTLVMGQEDAAAPPRKKQERKVPPPTPQTPLDGLTPVTTKSGLTYYDFKTGSGAPATPASKVAINYMLWFPDGTTFDSNQKLGKPAVLRLFRPEIIEGWREGIGSMKEGGMRRLEVPWSLGYGEEGKPPIGPKQDLIFEIELVKVFGADEEISDAPNVAKDEAARKTKPTSVDGLSPVTTASGLKYWDIKVGDGLGIGDETTVFLAQSSLWLSNGAFVDSTLLQGEAGRFTLRSPMTKGWSEGVSTMKVGGRRRLEVPAELGYGAKGLPPRIPANVSLIYEVDLFGIEEPATSGDGNEIGSEEQLLSVRSESNKSAASKPLAVSESTLVTTPSGLKYWDMAVGTGKSPEPTSQVVIRYVGWLKDGKVFDRSAARGDTETFPLSGAIAGWREGIGSMKVGGQRRLEVPPDLGYGGHEKGSPVPPNSTLVFDIELVDVK